jgi:hypothetical protein
MNAVIPGVKILVMYSIVFGGINYMINSNMVFDEMVVSTLTQTIFILVLLHLSIYIQTEVQGNKDSLSQLYKLYESP